MTASIPAPVRKAALLDNAVLLRLKFSRYGTSRKVATSQVEVNTDKRLLRVSKQILDSQEADAIGKIERQINAWVESQCLPSAIDKALWFVPLANVESVNARLKEMSAERLEAIESLCAVLPTLEERDRDQLKDLYSQTDYPSPEALRSAFAMEWYFLALTAPRSLEAVSEEMYMEAKRRMEQNIATATESVQAVLREQFKKLVDHMVDRLTPEEDGRKRIFKDSLTSNFKEFLAKFSTMNITEDDDLDKLVQNARRLLDGVEPDALRDLDDLRRGILIDFEKIQSLTDELIENEPTRRILI